jgi:plasmid stabilization system protein ParE
VKPIRLEDEASAELNEAARWYEQRQAGLGRRYLHAVDTTFKQIARMPQAGSTIPGVPADLGVRRAPVKQFPYVVAYLETNHAIRILAIVHERRRPGYWLTRL